MPVRAPLEGEVLARRFAPTGQFLALATHAWGMLFEPPPSRENVRVGDTIVVQIRGPLMHHAGWCDSYDELKGRVLLAIAEKPSAIVLAIDSPGGLVSGCFETATEIRAAAEAAGVPLYSYVDGAALSAGYALACAGSRIAIPSSGIAGSVGVVDMRIDATKADAMQGIAVTGIAVGERKLDGNPHVPMTEEELAATRARQEVLAGLFFDHVARARAVAPEAVRALKAGLVIGAAAVPVLADEVLSFDQMIAAIAAGTFGAPKSAAGETTMSGKAYEEAIAALRKMAAGDGPEAAKAKRMLKAELEEDDEDGEKKPEASAAEGEDGGEKKPEDEKKPAAAADKPKDEAASASSTSAAAPAEGSLAARLDALERQQLIATRPDFDDATKKILASAPLAEVRDFVEKAPRRALKPAATAVVGGITRAEGQGDGPVVPPLPADEARALDVAMGLNDGSTGIRYEGKNQILGVMTRASARAELERREKAAKTGAPTR